MKKHKKAAKAVTVFGLICILLGVLIVGFTLYPIFSEELTYFLHKPSTKVAVLLPHQKAAPGYQAITPVDTNFGIVIPKIGANAKVVPNVDPINERAYQYALTKGVAHAKGSSLPDEQGNVFIFAHSAGNFYEANRYNAVFYLLTKVEKNDSIYLIYKGKKYKYTVTSKQIVNTADTKYLYPGTTAKTVTLMTCWPPGTTLKRLIVIANFTSL